jgi:hypothetical protein
VAHVSAPNIELAEKYVKILDFVRLPPLVALLSCLRAYVPHSQVKDHMAFVLPLLLYILFRSQFSHRTKMKLFASFDAKVEKHNAVLDEREKALDGVRARLVQESGNVLGRG